MKKKEMLAMVVEMDKANDDCRNQNKAVSVEELAQCQQTAITLGSELEKRGERGEQLMHMLEEYCEYICQLGTDKGDATARRKLTKKIRQQLSRVKNAITYDLPDDKKEIVFLPYKASMWDSLESIWLAAKEDDTCETFVIPIPYCDKNPDGSIKQWH
ncbi:MAG: hypothetical protein LUE96_03660 [Lachnospiraceae bacterium]|nr:hypothetical protein [Lachnospiraceae bacterium]